jgi:hypothetical protein
MFPSEIWDRFKSLAGLLCMIGVGLYLLRCAVARDFISVEHFARFLRGLITYLLR